MPGFRPVDTKQSFPELEEQVLERWREREVFQRSLDQREGAELWNFYEGPPTANGRPGSHHVLARVFKDIYPRYRSMCGYRVPRKAGWDCHGLPVEIEVEKQLGISSKQEIEELGIDKFNARCRESVFEYVEEWNKLTERIGFWIDLDDPYVTLDDDYIESVWWSLKQLWDKDRLYEGHKVVPYCPRCGTALSSHEVALGYKDVEDPSIYVRFPLLGDDGSEAGESLLVWTTTPWTLPGNVAVAVAPDVTYVKARCGEEVLILAEPLLERVLGEDVEVLERLPGSSLVGRRYKGPVFELEEEPANAFRVVAGDFVTTEDGTGLVHIAPAFGEDDYAVAAANGIFDPTNAGTLFNPVNLEGRFDRRVSGFEGQFVKDPEVTKALIADLDARGLLFREQVYEHSYPHCWRCDTPLLYYAKSSWYVATSQVRDELLANNETIGWHPEHIKDGRFGKWLENNVDWALSRDRYWGTPLPIWHCTKGDCSELYCAGSVAELRERARGEVPEDLHRPYIDEVVLDCESCGGEMHRVKSVIDTWYDSGAMPFAQLHYPFENEELFAERFPADFICEAIDQTRGWFYTLLAESTLLFEGSSYRNCVCLGLILDPEGQKMSKSKGNVVEPWDVISAHGADAFRWYYLTAQQPWSGYRFSVDTVGESVRQFLLTLWNTYSFWVLYANAEDLTPADFPAKPRFDVQDTQKRGFDEANDLDRWALSKLQSTIETVRRKHGRVRLHRRRAGDRRVRRGALQLVRAALASALLGRRPRCLRDPAPLPARGSRAARSLHALPRRRDPPQPRRRRGRSARREPRLGPPARLPRSRSGAHRRRARGGDGGGAAHGRARPRRPRPGQGQGAPAAAPRRDRRQRRRARRDRGPRRPGHQRAQRQGARLRLRRGRPGQLRGQAQLPLARPALRQAHAPGRRRGRGARPRSRRQGDGRRRRGRDQHRRRRSHDRPRRGTLALQPLEGYEVEAEAGHAVALQLELDDELRREGLAREIVHAVQNARKAAGLDISDRIELSLGGDDELVAAARAHEPYIAGEVLATSVAYDAADGLAVRVDGRDLEIGVTKS